MNSAKHKAHYYTWFKFIQQHHTKGSVWNLDLQWKMKNWRKHEEFYRLRKQTRMPKLLALMQKKKRKEVYSYEDFYFHPFFLGKWNLNFSDTLSLKFSLEILSSDFPQSNQHKETTMDSHLFFPQNFKVTTIAKVLNGKFPKGEWNKKN